MQDANDEDHDKDSSQKICLNKFRAFDQSKIQYPPYLKNAISGKQNILHSAKLVSEETMPDLDLSSEEDMGPTIPQAQNIQNYPSTDEDKKPRMKNTQTVILTATTKKLSFTNSAENSQKRP